MQQKYPVSITTPKGTILVFPLLFSFPLEQKEHSSRTSLPGGKEVEDEPSAKEVEDEPSAVQEREALSGDK